MKKQSFNKLLSISLILVLMLLAACSGNKSSSTTAAPLASSVATESASAAPTPVSTNTAVKEPITLNLFVDQTWWPIKDWSGSVVEEITKRTGIKLNITVATDEKQLPLMIASGDLPDLVVTSTQNKRLANPDISYDWGDLIAKYAPNFKLEPEQIAVNKSSDGKFYTVKNYFSTKAEWAANKETALVFSGGISVREDILKALGNPELKSMEDLTNLFQKVKDKYPDMIPLVLNPPSWHRVYFEEQFGAQPGFNDVNGELKYMLHMQEYKKMYLYMNELYRKGFIKAENYAYKSEDQGKQLMSSGKGFAFSWTTLGSDLLTAGAKDKGYKFVNLPIKVSDTFKNVNTSAGWQGVYITKKNKNPEAAIKFMEFMHSDEGQKLALWGVDGKDWNMAKEGKYPVFTYNHIDDAQRKEKGVYYWGLLIGSATTELSGNYIPGTDSTKTSQALTALTTFNPAIGLVVPDADSAEQVIKANVENMIKNEEAKVLLATSADAASKAYDNIVAQADKMGLVKLEAWANSQYGKLKKQFE
jgi:putative aldouronate transport system substrate-binding protein